MRMRTYQAAAVAHVSDLYESGHARATIVLPCGTGKTVIATAAVRNNRHVLVFVPTVALLAQTLRVFSHERPAATLLAVCQPRGFTTRTSSTSAAEPPREEDDLDPSELGGLATTDPDVLADRLVLADGRPVIVVATYASSGVVAEATRRAGITWDVLVADEAHRTAGLAAKEWALPLNNNALPAAKRLFLTATPRVVSTTDRDPDTDAPLEVASMTDPSLFGPRYQPLTLREAITQGWLADYRVAVVAVRERDLPTGLVTEHGEPVDPTHAAAQIALIRQAAQHPHLNTALAFHNRVDNSREWATNWNALAATSAVATPAGGTSCVHIDGAMNATDRDAALDTLHDCPPDALRVVSNCRVLAEGVDVPALDCVVFAQPRSSAPEIVQIVGRALRPHPQGPHRRALIVIPVLVPEGGNVDDRAADSPFVSAWQVLTTLAHEDSALYDSLARLRWISEHPDEQLDGDDDSAATEEGGGADEDVQVDLDFTTLDPAIAERFRLRLLRRTTDRWTVLAQRLRNHVEAGGNVHPRRGFCQPDGYPLGERAIALRAAHASGRLHPSVVAFVERTVPDWTWEPHRRTNLTRTWDDYAELLEQHIARTGVPAVRAYETTTDHATGKSVALGAWLLKQQSRRSRLSAERRGRLDGLLGTSGWVRR